MKRDRRRESRDDVRIAATVEQLPDLDEGDRTTAAAQDKFLRQSGTHADMTCTGVIRNLSAQGAFVASTRSPPLRSRVRLAFEQVGGETMIVTGVVIWRRTELRVSGQDGRPELVEPGFGIVFESLSPPALAFVRSLVRQRDA